MPQNYRVSYSKGGEETCYSGSLLCKMSVFHLGLYLEVIRKKRNVLEHLCTYYVSKQIPIHSVFSGKILTLLESDKRKSLILLGLSSVISVTIKPDTYRVSIPSKEDLRDLSFWIEVPSYRPVILSWTFRVSDCWYL